MALAKASYSQLLGPEMRRVYVETGAERPLEYEMVFNVDTMGWNPQTDRNISGLGTMPTKNEGAAFALDEPINGNAKTYTAEPFGLAVEIPYNL